MNQFDNTPIGLLDTPTPSQSSASGNAQVMAIASIIFGVLGLCSSLIVGVCGLPFPIIGLILGFLAMRDPDQKTLAIIGMVISGLGLLIICVVILFTCLILSGPAIGNVFSDINQSLQTTP